jgi:hypothetical protein
MMDRNGADLRHAVREQGVADGCGEHDGEEDEVLGGLEGVLHFSFEQRQRQKQVLRLRCAPLRMTVQKESGQPELTA